MWHKCDGVRVCHIEQDTQTSEVLVESMIELFFNKIETQKKYEKKIRKKNLAAIKWYLWGLDNINKK